MRPWWSVHVCILFTLVLTSFCRDDQEKFPAESSILAKYVLTLSKPGAFNKTHTLFGEDNIDQGVTSCPPGEEGLECRRAEARRGVDDCPGGMCRTCQNCSHQNASQWPYCCQHNAMCCSQLAAACQRCDQHELNNFCSKHFKRCFLKD